MEKVYPSNSNRSARNKDKQIKAAMYLASENVTKAGMAERLLNSFITNIIFGINKYNSTSYFIRSIRY